jgi:predicted DNA-binding transcriptional regulator YafY
MSMTPEEAAAIALALAAVEASDCAAVVDLHGQPKWSSVDAPRTWLDFARREGLGLDADV